MSQRTFFEGFRKISPYLAILFIILSAIFIYLFQQEQKKSNGLLAPFTERIPPTKEDDMIYTYETGRDRAGAYTNSYKTSLNGQKGIYHELKVLIDQLNLWYNQRGIRYVDFRFSVVQNGDAGVNKFTVLIIPVSSRLNPNNSRDRIPHDGTDDVLAVDLGDLHP